jgi:cytochrome oxidase assembly protein ShyY1
LGDDRGRGGLALGRVVATAVEHIGDAVTWIVAAAALVIAIALMLRRLLLSRRGH